DRDDDVLTAVGTFIRHWRSALRSGHPDGTDFLPVFFFVRTKHRATRMVRRSGHRWVTEDHQGLGDDQTDAALQTRFRDVHPLEQRAVAYRVRCVAVWHLPLDLTLVEIDRVQESVRRLEQRQTLNRQATTAAALWRLLRSRRSARGRRR